MWPFTRKKIPDGDFKFTPNEVFRFEREENGNTVLVAEYHPGNVYNCTTGVVHDALRENCKKWHKKGMINIHPLPPGQSLKTVRL